MVHRLPQQSQWVLVSGSSDCDWSGFRGCGTAAWWCSCPSSEYNHDSFPGGVDGTYPETEDQIQVCFWSEHHIQNNQCFLLGALCSCWYIVHWDLWVVLLFLLSVQGALQLKQDFDSIRELIQSDKYGLSAELHQRLLSLRYHHLSYTLPFNKPLFPWGYFSLVVLLCTCPQALKARLVFIHVCEGTVCNDLIMVTDRFVCVNLVMHHMNRILIKL